MYSIDDVHVFLVYTKQVFYPVEKPFWNDILEEKAWDIVVML